MANEHRAIEFSKPRFIMLTISICIIAVGAFITYTNGGFNLGIDFQEGVNIVTTIDKENISEDDIRSLVENELPGAQVQRVGDPDDHRFMLRVAIGENDPKDGREQSGSAGEESRTSGSTGALGDESPGEESAAAQGAAIMSLNQTEGTIKQDMIESILLEGFGPGSVTIESVQIVGPKAAQQLGRLTLLIIALAIALVLVYIWIRFKIAYSISAIAAVVHDLAMILVILGILQLEFTTAIIAAILTIIGYSLNDTIVIFDRVRENNKIMRTSTLPQIVDMSITQSLSRTIITSITTFVAVFAIFYFTTGVVKNFALTVMIGVVIGTYSSIFVASPVLLAIKKAGKKSEKEKKTVQTQPTQQLAAEEAKKILEESKAVHSQSGGERAQPKRKRSKKSRK